MTRPFAPTSRALLVYGLAIRALALFVAFWLWMMPWVMNASGTRVICDEYGVPTPSPVGEEEETKHAVAFTWVVMPDHGGSDDDDAHPWSPADVPCMPLYGEVPHPPPWMG
ncbi:MAG: hypothetical protein KIT10_16110 [Flavobacteriales bacterium]|nr:hypothetical protein [Flavobacteriales bacterium]